MPDLEWLVFLEPGSPTMEEARVRWSHEPGGTHEGLFQICGSTDEEAAVKEIKHKSSV